MTPIRVARISSNETCKRNIQKRSKVTKELVSIIAGETGVGSQTTALVKSLPHEERASIMKSFKVNIPSFHVASMKSNLNIPWYQLRQISRWLRTFNIQLSSEKQAREVSKKWVGDGVQVELAPLTKQSASGRTEVVEKPWAYLYNVVGHILRHLRNLSTLGILVQHQFIPLEEIYVKIGGDHGGASFKMGYQICNVKNPNRKDNTIIFSLFEGKDTRSNLKLCLSRFKLQVKMLQKTMFNEKRIRVFLYGDYEFLCIMYGLTGANGK